MQYRTFICLFFIIVLNLPVLCQKYDAEVVSYSKVVYVEAASVKTLTNVELIVNGKGGISAGIVTVPYSKNISVSDIEGRIEDASGKVVKVLKRSDIIDRNEFTDAFYSDRFMKAFVLDYGNFPYKVFYSYTTTEKKYLNICYWHPVVYESVPVKQANLRIVIPADLKYKLKTYKLSDTTVRQDSKTIEFIFRSSYPVPVKEENYSNPISEIPYVIMLPESFENKFEGSWNTWTSYGNWISSLNEGKEVLTDEEKLNVERMVSGLSDKYAVIRKLYHFMQDNTRYINVIKGLGALEPFPASYVCKNRYGDCKALTIYMKALLAHAGIESFYTIINATDPPLDFLIDFPSHQFNHVILAVPVDNDTLWLENTNRHIPCGYLSSSTRNRPALLISQDKSRLVKTPAFDKMSVLTLEKQIYDLNISGPSVLALTYLFRGEAFETLNSIDGGANKNDVDRYIRKVMLFDDYEVKDWKITKANREEKEIELSVNMLLNNLVKPLGKDYYISLSKAGIPSFTKPALRKLPVLIAEPLYYIDTLIYNLPDGYALKNLYEPAEISSPYGSFAMSIDSDEKCVTVRREFLMLPGSIDLEKYSEFYAFIEEVRKLHSSKIIIKPLNL